MHAIHLALVPAFLLNFYLPTFHPAVAQEADAQVELMHFWRAPGEQHALAALTDPVKEAGIGWRDYTSEGNFSGMKIEYARRISLGSAPGILHWIMGNEMRRLSALGMTRTIPDDDGLFAKQLVPEVYDVIKMEGGISGIPVGIHTQNVIAYNRNLLAEFGLEPARNWDEFVSFGPVLAEHGKLLLALSDEQWQIRLLFSSILSTLINIEEFATLAKDDEDVARLRQPFEDTLSILFRIKPYTNLDYHKKDWQAVVQTADQGDALSIMFGDYMASEFSDEDGMHCSIVPGHKLVIWGADAFIFPTMGDDDAIHGQDAFITSATTPEHLLEYAYRKAAIPVLKDITSARFLPCLEQVFTDWSRTEEKFLIGGDFWQRRFVAIGSFLNEEWKKDSVDPAGAASRLIEILNNL